MAYSDINVGNVINVAGIEWIVLDKNECGVLCLTKDLIDNRMKFDNRTNNYTNSDIRRELCGNFLRRITDAVGEDALLDMTIDLISNDGLDDYGYVVDKVGLPTYDAYRAYNRVIEKYPVNRWWWLATPWSTPHRGARYTVCCVSSYGALGCSYCNDSIGVRPFCIFSSLIFES